MASCIKKPVLVMRLFIERSEVVSRGFVQVVGIEKELILEKMKTTLERPTTLPETSPYGDGKAAEGIVSIIKKEMIS